jgi:hypothetical protein
MSNSNIRIEKKKKETSKSNSAGIIGDYATMEELIEVKKAELIKAVPELDLSILMQRMGK